MQENIIIWKAISYKIMNKKIDFSKPLVVLAPLAGYTDLPFRSVVKKFGAD